MLRVGLTGGLGSGKSTVAAMLRSLGAEVIEADELGRRMMEPGHAVFDAIVRTFGPAVADKCGRLDRKRLGQIAFEGGRLDELNAIVHPAVIEAQQQWMTEVFRQNPAAVAVVESALIFEVERDARARGERDGLLADWRRRIDRVVVVTAPDEVKIARYAARLATEGIGQESAETDARQRMEHQMPDAEKISRADYVVENRGSLDDLRKQVEILWERLKEESNKGGGVESLE